MELRRALLLFAIVLGLAAVATSVSRPTSVRQEEAKGGASPPQGSGPRSAERPPAQLPPEIGFDGDRYPPPTEHLPAGRAVTVIVEVEEPGQVELQGLGLSSVADALTPARFDVLASDPARHDVRFRPASGAESRTLGVLAIDASGSRRPQRDPSSRGPQPEGPSTAARIAARGAGRPVHSSRLRAP